MIATSSRTACLSRIEYATLAARYAAVIAAQSGDSAHAAPIAAAAAAAAAASAQETGTSPDATGRRRFDGLTRSRSRSQTSLSRYAADAARQNPANASAARRAARS